MKILIIHFWIFLGVIFGVKLGFAQLAPQFAKKEFISAKGDTCRYRQLNPLSFDSKKKYPLVIFYHGAGERGKDNQKQLEVGVHQFATPINR